VLVAPASEETKMTRTTVTGSSVDDLSLPLLDQQIRQHSEDAYAFEPSKKQNAWMSVVVLFITACTISNVALACWLTASSTATPERVPTPPPKYPNVYIGLEKVWKGRTPEITHFNNRPIALSSVSNVELDKIFPIDARRYRSASGSVSPDEWQFLIKPEISSIAQFRVRDAGYEVCTVQVNLPPVHTVVERLWNATLDVWVLDVKEKLDLRLLSHNNKPPRTSLLDTISAFDDYVSSSRNFSCISGERLAFELTCNSGECDIDLWQGHTSQYGVQLLQYYSGFD